MHQSAIRDKNAPAFWEKEIIYDLFRLSAYLSSQPTPMKKMNPITLATPLSLRSSFGFPLQSPLARREVLIGALLLLIPVIGWILNMGHRIMMVHRMQHGLPAWPAWRDYPALFRHGFLTLLGMIEYHAPAVVCEYLAWTLAAPWLHGLAALLWVLATVAVPGYMSHYCLHFDAREIFDPFRAMRRVFEGGRAYWHAWGIALAALALSFVGLLGLGLGFLLSSVWFWQVAGFSFATVFSEKFQLAAKETPLRM